MNTMKKNWALLAIGLVSILLAVLAILTAFRLREEGPIAPTAPQSEPQALDGDPVPACEMSFTLTITTSSPSPSPALCRQACTDDSNCPSGYSCFQFFDGSRLCINPVCGPADTDCLCGASPTPTPSASPAVSPTPPPQCGATCTTSANCPSTMTCSGGLCRNPQCISDTDCICPAASPTPAPQCNQACTSSTQCPSSMICYIPSGQTSGNCRASACQTNSDCLCPGASPSPTPPPQCGANCSTNADCPSGMACNGNVCRNPACSSDTDCVCSLAQAQPSPSVVPNVPVAGTNWPTLFLIMGGVALLVIGFALP